jgi:hypothetical protein
MLVSILTAQVLVDVACTCGEHYQFQGESSTTSMLSCSLCGRQCWVTIMAAAQDAGMPEAEVDEGMQAYLDWLDGKYPADDYDDWSHWEYDDNE